MRVLIASALIVLVSGCAYRITVTEGDDASVIQHAEPNLTLESDTPLQAYIDTKCMPFSSTAEKTGYQKAVDGIEIVAKQMAGPTGMAYSDNGITLNCTVMSHKALQARLKISDIIAKTDCSNYVKQNAVLEYMKSVTGNLDTTLCSPVTVLTNKNNVQFSDERPTYTIEYHPKTDLVKVAEHLIKDTGRNMPSAFLQLVPSVATADNDVQMIVKHPNGNVVYDNTLSFHVEYHSSWINPWYMFKSWGDDYFFDWNGTAGILGPGAAKNGGPKGAAMSPPKSFHQHAISEHFKRLNASGAL